MPWEGAAKPSVKLAFLSYATGTPQLRVSQCPPAVAALGCPHLRVEWPTGAAFPTPGSKWRTVPLASPRSHWSPLVWQHMAWPVAGAWGQGHGHPPLFGVGILEHIVWGAGHRERAPLWPLVRHTQGKSLTCSTMLGPRSKCAQGERDNHFSLSPPSSEEPPSRACLLLTPAPSSPRCPARTALASPSKQSFLSRNRQRPVLFCARASLVFVIGVSAAVSADNAFAQLQKRDWSGPRELASWSIC